MNMVSDKEELHTDIRNAAICPVILAARTHNTVATHTQEIKIKETLVKLVFALLYLVICISKVGFSILNVI